MNNPKRRFKAILATGKRGLPERSEPMSGASNTMYKICLNMYSDPEPHVWGRFYISKTELVGLKFEPTYLRATMFCDLLSAKLTDCLKKEIFRETEQNSEFLLCNILVKTSRTWSKITHCIRKSNQRRPTPWWPVDGIANKDSEVANYKYAEGQKEKYAYNLEKEKIAEEK